MILLMIIGIVVNRILILLSMFSIPFLVKLNNYIALLSIVPIFYLLYYIYKVNIETEIKKILYYLLIGFIIKIFYDYLDIINIKHFQLLSVFFILLAIYKTYDNRYLIIDMYKKYLQNKQ